MNDKENEISNLEGSSLSMLLAARLTLALPQPVHGPPLSRKTVKTDSFWRGGNQIARPLANGYVATAQSISNRFQYDPYDGLGEWLRHGADRDLVAYENRLR